MNAIGGAVEEDITKDHGESGGSGGAHLFGMVILDLEPLVKVTRSTRNYWKK